MNNLEYQVFYKRHLPHLQLPGATLFITFRLAGSIPVRVQQQLIDESRRIDKALERIQDSRERAIQALVAKRRAFLGWEQCLDAVQCGSRYLENRQIADLVCDSIHQRDGDIYDLIAFCIMPNHVHIVFTPNADEDGSYYAMSSIMHSMKRYTARQANKILRREGDFWQHENYDHFARDKSELVRIVSYVLNNPVKAGLVKSHEQWEWSYSKYLDGQVTNLPYKKPECGGDFSIPAEE